MRKVIFFVIAIVMITGTLTAQVAVNNDGSSPDASAMLDVTSADKGILMPRMSQAEIATITNPANGLTVFNTDDNRFYFYNAVAGEWKEIDIGAGTITPWECGDIIIDNRDGKSYNTVQIGTQCWFVENLNIGIKISSINGGSNNDGEQTNNATIEKYCYDNIEANCTTYGGLYKWAEMVQYHNGASDTSAWNPVPTNDVIGICPFGWHLPTDTEWDTLVTFLGSESIAGGKMKEAGTVHWISPNTGASNSSGFTSIASGFISANRDFINLGYTETFWSSTMQSSLSSWTRHLYWTGADVARGPYSTLRGYTVRCIRD